MHLRAKRGKTTVFLSCSGEDTIGALRIKLAGILSLNVSDLAILLDKDALIVQGDTNNLRPGLDDAETVSNLGLIRDQEIYYILRDSNTEIWEKVDVQEPKL
jgi:hypothetical protein